MATPCRCGAKSATDENPIRLVARHVGAGQKLRHADGGGQGFAGLDQPDELPLGRRPGADDAEFDVAGVGAGFAARPPLADREARDAARAFEQHRIAEFLCERRADFAAQIEARINRLGNFAARPHGLVLLRAIQCAQARPSGSGFPLHRRRHDRGEKARVKSVFLIERDVFCALRKGEQPDLSRPPRLELLHRPSEQGAGDAALLQIRVHRQWAKETDAAPIGREVRAAEIAIQRRAECGDVSRRLAAVGIIPIGPERLQVGNAEESAEGETDDSRGFRQVFLPSARTTGWLAFAVATVLCGIGSCSSVAPGNRILSTDA